MAAKSIAFNFFPSKIALCISPPEDLPGVFHATEREFAERVKALQTFGYSVDIQRDLKTTEKIERYILETYPDGIDYLYWRAHSNPQSMLLSKSADGGYLYGGGIYDPVTGHLLKARPEKEVQREKRIFQSIRSGGVCLFEGCNAGEGDYNLAKKAAAYCQTNVLVIASTTNDFFIEFYPSSPKYVRFITQNSDVTRMYYQTQSGPVEIPVYMFDLINAHRDERELTESMIDLCFRWFGEYRNCELSYFLKDDWKKKIGDFDCTRSRG